MEYEIKENLVFLTEKTTNLSKVLMYLIQTDIISENESEEIIAERTSFLQNSKLYFLIQKKDWKNVRNVFLDILQKTNNGICATVIERTRSGISVPDSTTKEEPSQPVRILHSEIKKWWPVKKRLINSLHRRKIGLKLLVEELHNQILMADNQRVVICESPEAARLTGMGGVGKTVTAKWYANHYEDYYDHIIWIDSGEGSLLKSFKSLTTDLDIPHFDRLQEAEEFARKAFEELSEFKCLWIYDNAESYQGSEGIINVLPECHKNFSCLITSRSRDWGVENGYGKIPQFELDIFSEEESIIFLTKNLTVECKEYDLKELCRLLGNLPLALQLAVATLNCGKINIKNYLEKTSAKEIESIVDAKFEAYEKTIIRNVKISLNLIEKEKNGKLANEILKVFGYIRPEDVQSKLFLKLLSCKLNALKEAIDLLQKYFLVSKTGKIWELPYDEKIFNWLFGRRNVKVEMDLLSIHRLLQQVIRFNENDTEDETLRKILGCTNFVEYKLIPFTKYASEKLQNEFPKVKTELLDQSKLAKFIKEGRFEESVQLSRFIDEELKTKTTKFNFCVCLNKNGQLEDCVNTLAEIYHGVLTEEIINAMPYLLQISIKNSLQILIEYWKINEMATFLVDLKREPMEMEIGALLIYSYVRMGHCKEAIVIGEQIILNVGHLIQFICLTHVPNFHLNIQLNAFHLDVDVQTKTIELKQEVKKKNYNSAAPRRFSCLPSIEYNYPRYFTDSVIYQVNDYAESKGNWIVPKVIMSGISFKEKAKLRFKELEFSDSTLDISYLPQTLQKLKLVGAKVTCGGVIDLPKLKYLTLFEMNNSRHLFLTRSFLSHIQLDRGIGHMEENSYLSLFSSAQLTHIELDCEISNLDLLPKTVKQLKTILSAKRGRQTVKANGFKNLEKLVVEDYSFRFGHLKEYMSHFQADCLVAHAHNYKIKLKELRELKAVTRKIAVGIYVNCPSGYYLWEGGSESQIKKEEFDQLAKLF